MSQPVARIAQAGVGSWHQWRMWISGLLGSRYDGLTHFHVVQAGVLLRCGQPALRDLEAIRRMHGLRTIVAARGGTRHPLRGRWFREERAWCAQHGIRFVHLPFSDAATPPGDVFDAFLRELARPQNLPLLVHCEQGFHRTGVLCAAFRIAVQGWSLDEALAELHTLGFEPREKRQPLVTALTRWAAQRGGAGALGARSLLAARRFVAEPPGGDRLPSR